MIQAGLLDRAVTLQLRTKGKDTSGGPTETWVDGATVPARVRPIAMSERFQAEAIRVSRFLRVEVRYFLPFNASDFRLKYENQVYQIRGYAELGRREGWDITAEFMQ